MVVHFLKRNSRNIKSQQPKKKSKKYLNTNGYRSKHYNRKTKNFETSQTTSDTAAPLFLNLIETLPAAVSDKGTSGGK